MYISKFQIINYKSYAATPILNLVPGFNLVTGQNNVGKTALLEAMSLQFAGKPHRSLKALPTRDSQPIPTTTARFSLKISSDELRSLLLVPNRHIYIPIPDHTSDFAREIGYRGDDESSQQSLAQWVLSQPEPTFDYELISSEGSSPSLRHSSFPALQGLPAQGGWAATQGQRAHSGFVVADDKSLRRTNVVGTDASNDFGMQIGAALVGRVYYFHAQRLNVGSCSIGVNGTLDANAQNLASVLNLLQPNRYRFEKFNQLVTQIIPQVQWISVRPIGNNQVEIVVWNHDPKSQREDLGFSLNESGTGLGQVLAILYVLLTSHNPRTIIIDEPQSFLHRGAARKLMELLKQHPQHQYIIATHSPTIITATNPSTITLVRQSDGESTTEMLDATEVAHQRRLLAEVGATPADVFGYDNILWVEGETEEVCIPKIVEKVSKKSLMGTAIRRVKHTGDFERRDANLVFDIYDRLSHGRSLLPPAIGFLFDDECRTESEKKEIRRRSGNKTIFIPRRMYENYLLSPPAIAAVLNDAMRLTGYDASPITEHEVGALLEAKRKDRKYFARAEEKAADADWIKDIHAANLLTDLFSELSKNKAPVTFDKLRHSVALTDWLIENSPDDLAEIAGVIVGSLKCD